MAMEECGEGSGVWKLVGVGVAAVGVSVGIGDGAGVGLRVGSGVGAGGVGARVGKCEWMARGRATEDPHVSLQIQKVLLILFPALIKPVL